MDSVVDRHVTLRRRVSDAGESRWYCTVVRLAPREDLGGVSIYSEGTLLGCLQLAGILTDEDLAAHDAVMYGARR